MSAPMTLEEQITLLKRENALLKQENYHLSRLRVSGQDWDDLCRQVNLHLVRKVHRQRLANMRLQWRGWEPELIIQEVA